MDKKADNPSRSKFKTGEILIAYLLFMLVLGFLPFVSLRQHESDQFITDYGFQIIWKLFTIEEGRTSIYFGIFLLLPVTLAVCHIDALKFINFPILFIAILFLALFFDKPLRFFPAEEIHLRLGFYLTPALVMITVFVMGALNLGFVKDKSSDENQKGKI